jgi:hypothetical protein
MSRSLLLIALLACNVACNGAPRPAPPSAAARVERRTASNPLIEHALPPEQQTWLDGEVEESIPAGSYVYLRVRAGDRPPVWVVSLAITTPKSPRVRVLVLGSADRFTSRRLGRDFSPLLFGAVRAASDEPSSKGTAS